MFLPKLPPGAFFNLFLCFCNAICSNLLQLLSNTLQLFLLNLFRFHPLKLFAGLLAAVLLPGRIDSASLPYRIITFRCFPDDIHQFFLFGLTELTLALILQP